MVAYSYYGLLLAQLVTTARRGDSRLLPLVVERAEALHD